MAANPLHKTPNRSDPETMSRFFEMVLNELHSFSKGGSLERTVHDLYWVEPLVEAGLIAVRKEEQRDWGKDIYFAPTPAGLRWWYQARLDYEAKLKKESASFSTYDGYFSISKPEDLRSEFYGMGIGGEYWTHLSHPRSKRGAIFQGLLDGLFEFVKHYDYYPQGRGFQETITVRLTEKGFWFYHNLPVLEEVW